MPPVRPETLARRDEIVARLAEIVGTEHVIVTEDERRAYEADALTAYRAVPLAVVLPGTTEEVSAVVRYLSGSGVKMIARQRGAFAGCGRGRPRAHGPDSFRRL